MDGQHDTFGEPSWVSHIPTGHHNGLQSFQEDWVFSYDYFVTGEDNTKTFFYSWQYTTNEFIV
jgi:hypothetical protein